MGSDREGDLRIFPLMTSLICPSQWEVIFCCSLILFNSYLLLACSNVSWKVLLTLTNLFACLNALKHRGEQHGMEANGVKMVAEEEEISWY